MVQGSFFSGQDDFSIIQNIRKQVFEEPAMWENERDISSMHAVVYSDNQAVGAGTIFYDGWECVISHVGVLPAYRGQKFGDFIVRMLIDKAVMANVEEIYLITDKKTAGFFEKIGFQRKKDIDEKNFVLMGLRKEQIFKCCDCHEKGE